MHKKKILLIVTILALFCINLSAQNNVTKDTIETKLQLTSTDTGKINYLTKTARPFIDNLDIQGLEISQRAYRLAKSINDRNGIANSLNNIAIYYKGIGDMKQCIKYQSEVSRIRREMGDSLGIARAYNNLGLAYAQNNDYLKALDYQFRALKIKENIKSNNEIAYTYSNIGLIFSDMGENEKAKQYFEKAIENDKKTNDINGLAIDLQSYSNVYYNLKDYKKARELQYQALGKFNENNQVKSIADAYNNIANIDAQLGNFKLAIEEYNKALEIQQKIKYKKGIAGTYANLGETYTDMLEYTKAEDNLKKALEICNQINARGMRNSVYEMMTALYENSGDYKLAFIYQRKFKELNDSLTKENNLNKLNEQGLRYDIEKKTRDIEILERDKKIKESSIKVQSYIRNFLICIVLIVVLFAVFILRLNRIKERAFIILNKQKNKIEIQKTEITDSLNYALRLQQAVMPPRDLVTNIFPDSFIYSKAKNIVSGDFYFVHHPDQDKILDDGNAHNLNFQNCFIGIADCTGHGVPGALMSIIGLDALNESCKKHTDIIDIFHNVNKRVKDTLHLTQQSDSIKDGMDMAMCTFDFKNNYIQFIGANRPIIKISNGILYEYIPNKATIGGLTADDYVFTASQIPFIKGDTFYFYTDGFADQFGGTKGKKLKTKKFKELLRTIYNMSMREQQEFLAQFLYDWRNDNEQVDDILVMGLRV